MPTATCPVCKDSFEIDESGTFTCPFCCATGIIIIEKPNEPQPQTTSKPEWIFVRKTYAPTMEARQKFCPCAIHVQEIQYVESEKTNRWCVISMKNGERISVKEVMIEVWKKIQGEIQPPP